MKLNEIFEGQSLIAPSEFDRKGTKMGYPNFYKFKDAGKKTSVRPETVTVKDSKTGKIYGSFH